MPAMPHSHKSNPSLFNLHRRLLVDLRVTCNLTAAHFMLEFFWLTQVKKAAAFSGLVVPMVVPLKFGINYYFPTSLFGFAFYCRGKYR